MAARPVCGTCGWRGTATSPARAAAMGDKHVCKTNDGVRRTTRRFRCGRCGLETVYENAGATEARSWFRRHSCRRREEAMLRTAIAEEKRALVDRTPKPCLHKVAGHQHGTNACYVLDGCRCEPCSGARADHGREWARLKAYGRYHKYVMAEHVRAHHLAELKAYGIGLKQVSRLSGVSNGSLTKIWYGLYADTGRGSERRHGEGQLVRGPSRRVLRSTAEKIYAVEAIPANLGSHRPDHERTPLARQHVRALVALGWSMSGLGRRFGLKETSVRNFIGTVTYDDRVMYRQTVDRIEELYAELSMTLPPANDQRSRISVSRSKKYAALHGWLPPLAIEDLDDDLVLVDDSIDEVAIERRLDGDLTVALSVAEKVELVRIARGRGWSFLDLERRAGISKPERYLERELEVVA